MLLLAPAVVPHHLAQRLLPALPCLPGALPPRCGPAVGADPVVAARRSSCSPGCSSPPRVAETCAASEALEGRLHRDLLPYATITRRRGGSGSPCSGGASTAAAQISYGRSVASMLPVITREPCVQSASAAR